MAGKPKPAQAKAAEANPAKANPAKAKKTKKEGKHFNNAFVAEVALASQQTLTQACAFLYGLHTACLKTLKEKKRVRIPQICQIKMKIVPAKPQREKLMFGRMRTIPARPERKKISCGVLNQFQHTANAE